VAEVDAMSEGRVELGLGAGWYEDEHKMYGIGFPAVGERFDRLEEQLAIITGLWETPVGDLFQFSGKHYRLEPGPALPKPVQQPRPPVIVGGHGPRRTPALAARFADEFNVAFSSIDVVERQYRLVDDACRAIGRDPGSVRRSAALVLCCGSDEHDVNRRAANIGRAPDELRQNGAAGTPSEVVAKLRAYGAIGASTVYLQVLDLADLDHIRLVADEVLPALA
jgi:alkanesulfonate monooxygenase SsuD/methylene tetrahydromethanopterin reductase-like flavin-dependent oxidoreductase (luciferase family)